MSLKPGLESFSVQVPLDRSSLIITPTCSGDLSTRVMETGIGKVAGDYCRHCRMLDFAHP